MTATVYRLADNPPAATPSSPPRSAREESLDLVACMWGAVKLTEADLPEFAAMIRGADVDAGLAAVTDASVVSILKASQR